MTRHSRPFPGAVGWLGAALTSAALLGGAGAVALTAQPEPAPLMLDLGQSLPASPALAAIAEAAPQVVDEAPDQAAPPAQNVADPPPLPEPERRVSSVVAPPISLPKPDVLAQSDLSVPAPMAPTPDIEPKQAETPKTPPPKQKSAPKAAKVKASSAAPSAPVAGAKAKGGAKTTSAASYAKAVMKKVRATKKQSGAGKGIAVVGFAIGATGHLASAKIIRSSGKAAFDEIAISHIQRAAPFPVPPEGAGRSFSFEFVGK